MDHHIFSFCHNRFPTDKVSCSFWYKIEDAKGDFIARLTCMYSHILIRFTFARIDPTFSSAESFCHLPTGPRKKGEAWEYSHGVDAYIKRHADAPRWPAAEVRRKGER